MSILDSIANAFGYSKPKVKPVAKRTYRKTGTYQQYGGYVFLEPITLEELKLANRPMQLDELYQKMRNKRPEVKRLTYGAFYHFLKYLVDNGKIVKHNPKYGRVVFYELKTHPVGEVPVGPPEVKWGKKTVRRGRLSFYPQEQWAKVVEGRKVGKSYKQLAKETGIPFGTICSYLHNNKLTKKYGFRPEYKTSPSGENLSPEKVEEQPHSIRINDSIRLRQMHAERIFKRIGVPSELRKHGIRHKELCKLVSLTPNFDINDWFRFVYAHDQYPPCLESQKIIDYYKWIDSHRGKFHA